MSTTHKLPFVRFTRQVRTEPQSVLATDVAAANALAILKNTPWIQQPEVDPTFPPRAAMLADGTALPEFDAYKYVGDYADGKQKAYAGAVAYRFQVPAAALTGPTNITSIAIPIYVDRWLVDGINVAAYLSDSPAPPTAWATIRAGDKSAANVLPMTYTDPGGVRIVVEKNGTTTLTWDASTPSKKFVYVMLTLEDYESVRGFWIEGASLVQGAEAVTTFAASVAADVSGADADYATPLATSNWFDVLSLAPYGAGAAGVDFFESYGYELMYILPTHTNNPAYLADDTGLVKLSAVINQLVVARNGSYMDYGSPIITPSAGIAIQRVEGEGQHYVYFRDLIFPLVAPFNAPVRLSAFRFADAFPAYPVWLRLKLNVYSQVSTNFNQSFEDPNWMTEKTAYTKDPNWIRGSYSSNGMVNLLSSELSPAGHVAQASFSTKAVNLDGLQRIYVTVQIAKIISEPDATLVPEGVDLNGTPFVYPYKTKTIYIN